MIDLTPLDIESIKGYEAKTQSFNIVKNGKVLGNFVITEEVALQVKLVPLEVPISKRKIGTLKGKIIIPDDFDNTFEDEIANMFNEIKRR